VSRAELEQPRPREDRDAQLAVVNSQIRENQVQLQYYRVTAPSDASSAISRCGRAIA